jgi:hypothetical protein
VSQQKFIVYGSVTFPLQISVRAASQEEAAKYAHTVLNDKEILKCEIEVETKNGKKPLIICDDYKFNWTSTSEE